MISTFLSNGLYVVSTNYFTAGFVVVDGRVKYCAPILRKKLEYWMTVARKVSD